jgi:hypothetical protein
VAFHEAKRRLVEVENLIGSIHVIRQSVGQQVSKTDLAVIELAAAVEEIIKELEAAATNGP